jgi:hypothetical protein
VSKFLWRVRKASLSSNKRNTLTTDETRKALEARQVNAGYGRRVEVRGGRLNDFRFQALPTKLKHARSDNLPWVTAAGRGGCMLYGIAAVDQNTFSHDTVLRASDLTDAASTQPPARAPDRPSSTR